MTPEEKAVIQAAIELRVERLGADTRHAAIVALMERASVDKPRLARLADRIATPFLLGVVLASAAAAAWWWSAGPAHALSVAVAVLVVTCPCALSLATPAATLAAAGALARRGVLVRQLQALESGATVDTLVFDKTGTLTRDRMSVTAIRSREGLAPQDALYLAAALASGSLHPASRAVVAAAGDASVRARLVLPGLLAGAGDVASPGKAPSAGPAPDAAPVEGAITERPGQGVEGRVAGRRLRLGSAAFCGAPDPPAEAADHSQVHLADESGWMASFDLDEALRPDALEALTQLRAMGLELRLLSGDRPAAVARLAARAGLTDPAHWRGGCTPQDKMAEVRALQQQGRRVAMVGDGMNDGPVLALADLSVAMGEGVPLAQARADVVVQGGRLMPVADLLAQARRTQRVVRRNLAWAAFYNAASVPLAVAGLMPAWLAGIGMAASSLLVVMNSARLATVRPLD